MFYWYWLDCFDRGSWMSAIGGQSISSRGVFKTQFNIYDEDFCEIS